MLEIVNWQKVITYLVIINLVGFAFMGIDKYKARNDKWRISEKTLFIITALFGGIGTIAGMYYFRHKNKKWYFVFGFPAIVIIEFSIAVYLIFFWVNPATI